VLDRHEKSLGVRLCVSDDGALGVLCLSFIAEMTFLLLLKMPSGMDEERDEVVDDVPVERCSQCCTAGVVLILGVTIERLGLVVSSMDSFIVPSLFVFHVFFGL
jgi:hypothetical protein